MDLLGITEEEQKHLKTIIGKNEKYIRNNIRRQENRRNEIQVEKSLGLSQSKVAKKLNLSISTVKRYWNF
nr:hypothetical protein [Clostridioides sp. ES-S-0107-01]UDN53021.1 hypothetical protein JJC16_18325 [Clostridioides sp. ES-S-0107-01]